MLALTSDLLRTTHYYTSVLGSA